MFLGHHAVALSAKRAAPRTSLGTFVFAATLIDLAWPILLLLGVERTRIDPGNTAFTPLDFEHYPVSHSLAMVLLWSVLFGALYFALTRYGRGAVIAGVLVLSHWVLDFLTHRPDLPLWPNGPKVGLGIWNSVPLSLLLEFAFLIAGVWIYTRMTRARDRAGSIGFWSLVAFLALIQVANVFSPPPPSWQAVAWTALAAWLFVPWAAWVDRHREGRG